MCMLKTGDTTTTNYSMTAGAFEVDYWPRVEINVDVNVRLQRCDNTALSQRVFR